ncbi:hypothetical protein GBF35_25935 [Nonomuraea phyllanthi]|uniref:hypothetical protein n=1 Tax=Nonomuraea phyllanthi TaxID=2219224 RepID=UPI0012936415|nr:hypothetical protein [Nonomuraea phyllanthi]QFY09636.1 hypothetical protein GBF35_25935 [Nonomuraea phyllanthi]
MGHKVNTVDGKAGDVDLSAARTFTKEYRVPKGVAGTYMVTRLPVACTAIAVRAYRAGGIGGAVNAQRNGGNLLAEPLATTTDAWAGWTHLQNAAFAAGDTLSVVTADPAGSPAEVIVQVDFRVNP